MEDRHDAPGVPRTSYGVDGCRGGWFWVALEPDGSMDGGVVKTLAELVERAEPQDRIFVDMPIGLQREPRECDLRARKFLGPPRASSVFPTPMREALAHCDDHGKASRCNHEMTGKKLSIFTFGILPKIREVDDLLHDDDKSRDLVHEVHPEVCFRGFAERPMEFSKKSEDGYRERVDILEKSQPGVERFIKEMMARFPKKSVARDDIVDAIAAAVTASTDPPTLRTLPDRPPLDSEGLPMRMFYANGIPPR